MLSCYCRDLEIPADPCNLSKENSNVDNTVDTNFCDINNEDLNEQIIDNLVKKIESKWETRYANGRMKKWIFWK